MPRSIRRLGAKQIVDALLVDGIGHRHLARGVQRIERLPGRVRVRDHFGKLAPPAIGTLQRGKRARRGFDQRPARVTPREAEQVERTILRRGGLRAFEPLHRFRDGRVVTRLVRILPVLLDRVDRQRRSLEVARRHRRAPAFVRRPVPGRRLHRFDVTDGPHPCKASSAACSSRSRTAPKPTLATPTTFRSMMRSGDGIIDCGSCANLARRRNAPVARDGGRGRHEILRVARIAAANADEVVTLFLEQRQALSRSPSQAIATARDIMRRDCALSIASRTLRGAAEQARHLRVAAPAGEHVRGFVVVGREARVGALRYEQLHDIGVHGIRTRSEHQRRIAAAVSAVHVCATIEQQLHSLGVSRAGGVAERRFAEFASPRSRRRPSRAAAGRRPVLPLVAAAMSAVAPAPFFASTRAPLSISRRIASTSPRRAAPLSGVSPLSVATLGSPPFSSSSRSTA